MADIQVLVENAADRSAIASLLEELGHTVTTDGIIQKSAVYILGDYVLPKYREQLREIKREQTPVFCPVILIRRPHTKLNLSSVAKDSMTDDAPVLIDEVLSAPVTKPILARRVANLVTRREQTAELARQNDRLEDFASIVSHDLRNPLSIAEGYLDLEMAETESENLRQVAQAHERMRELIEDILLLARVGALIDDVTQTDLASVANDSWKNVDSPTQRLVVDAEKELYADVSRLMQLFENMFRNAVEHGGDDIRLEVGDLSNGFYIEDTGAGIPSPQREKLFEEGASAVDEGVGIGLRIVSEIVDAHDWEIVATESDEGGARFEITNVERPDRPESDSNE